MADVGASAFLFSPSFTERNAYSGLLSFELRANDEKESKRQAAQLLSNVTLFAPAPSLGGTESLITIPGTLPGSALTRL
jgi:cystathionine beta-lyase/cystathionine gamma-synthase